MSKEWIEEKEKELRELLLDNKHRNFSHQECKEKVKGFLRNLIKEKK